MTYLEYVKLLVAELQLKKVETLKMYEDLIRIKGHLNAEEQSAYLCRVNDWHLSADNTEKMMRCLINGSISAYDEVD
jgi:outer membrane biogenesis lipoprotein LolB